MLNQRILDTLKFYDLQGIPLTLFEIHKLLLNDNSTIKDNLDSKWEIDKVSSDIGPKIQIEEIAKVLDNELSDEVKSHQGHYFLSYRDKDFVKVRLVNYHYAVIRESRIARYSKFLSFIPYIRGVGLVGSQALGAYKKDSDIDLFIITAKNKLWTGRIFLTFYFQLIGKRRHGQKVANRFCLNHYIEGTKPLTRDRNVYTASEYVKMRSLSGSGYLSRFKLQNLPWLKLFFPNTEAEKAETKVYGFRNTIEKFLDKIIGPKFESWMKSLLIRRISQDEFVVVDEDELSFHPHNRKSELFNAFFKN